MKALFLPLILLLLGVGGGVGAGIFLAPPAEPEMAALGPCGDAAATGATDHMAAAEAGHAPAADGHDPAAAEVVPAGQSTGFEYVKMNNQFVVPVVEDGAVRAMVVLTLSVEVTLGTQAAVFTYEPKMRDVFLQVLFDHANVGGFDGNFTSAENMRSLRRALKLAGQDAVGEQVHDVLITDIVRQDV